MDIFHNVIIHNFQFSSQNLVLDQSALCMNIPFPAVSSPAASPLSPSGSTPPSAGGVPSASPVAGISFPSSVTEIRHSAFLKWLEQ